MNLIAMGIFGMMFLAVLAIVSNSGATSISNISQQFDRLSCPMPSSSGLWNSTGTLMYTNGTYNYEAVNINVNTLTCSEVHTLDGFDYFYGSPTLPFAGFGFFIGDWISELIANKLSALFTIIFYILTPANFNILGYTIDDITGFGLMFVITLYAFCYISIGAMIYKIVSPFSGVG